MEKLVEKLIKKLKKKKLFLGVMESCTGGGLANAITNVVGASEIFKGGIVAYATEIKVNFGVSQKIIKKYSVYSPEVALAMAKVARKKLKADIGVGITGSISRVDPNEPKSKIGEIFIAVIFGQKFLVRKFIFPNKKRSIVKSLAILKALKMIDQII
ncbi:MAG: CinA family protein [Patescibacteria group bacterium]